MSFWTDLRNKAAQPTQTVAQPPAAGPQTPYAEERMPTTRPGSRDPQASGGGNDVLSFIANWQATHSPSEGIAPLADALRQAGYDVPRFMYGNTPSNNELVVNGEKWKVLGGEGGPAAYWYKPGMNDMGGAPSGGGGLPGGYSVGMQTGGGRYPLSSFSAEGLAAPWTTPFERRSPEEIAQDPAFQFQMKQGADAIQRSASAKGTLLTGGTLKDLTSFAQGLAHTYDDKYYNRDLGEYTLAHDIFGQNQQNAFGRLFDLSQLGLNAQGQVGGYGTNYMNQASDMLSGVGNVQGAGAIAQGNAKAGIPNTIADFANAALLYRRPGATAPAPATPPYNPETDWQGPLPPAPGTPYSRSNYQYPGMNG